MLINIYQSIVHSLRDAEWLTRERVSVYTLMLLCITFIISAGWTFMSNGEVDLRGKPIGTDFLSFWAASKVALAGSPALAYDPTQHDAVRRAVVPGLRYSRTPYFYPPLYLLVCLPLALAPYLVALAMWLLATGFACWRTIRSILGQAGSGLMAPMLAFPGVFENVGDGQNAFLTTALLGSGALTLGPRPILAGVFFGLLAFKPHLGVLIPVALVAGSRWKTLAAASCTVVAFAAISLLAFGSGTWRAFFIIAPFSRIVLEQDWFPGASISAGWVPAMMASVFAGVRVLHGGIGLAYAVQGAAALVAGGMVIRVSRRGSAADGLAQGVVLVCATLLATPYLFDYDLMILAIPIAWIVREAHRTGFRPWEKSVLFAAFLLPLLSRTIAGRLGVPISPPILMALLVVVAGRALSPRRMEQRRAWDQPVREFHGPVVRR